MRERITCTDYAGTITEMLKKGILLNTNGDKFNSMVIGWGHLGTLWGRPTFAVYVRQSRYTKAQIDKTGEFTISIPLEQIDEKINRVCGSMSGADTDKAAEAGLTVEEPSVTKTPGIREYPLTLECRVLYSEDLDVSRIPADIVSRFYPDPSDFHTMYVGEIVSAYIL